MTLKNKGRGNRKAQRERRRERLKHLPKKRMEKVQLIDGNWTFYPVTYCKVHGGFLTQGLIETHRCDHRQCRGFIEDEESRSN